MSITFIFLLMIFCHIVDDYYLQKGSLSNLKQRSFWEENAPDLLYRYDYIVALIMHSFSWAFMVMLPIAFTNSFDIDIAFLVIFIVNVFIHAVTDHLKANAKVINLICDQTIHILQIIVTLIILS